MRIGITERGDGGIDQSWLKRMDQVDGAIIITKAPHLINLETLPGNTVVHCTITGLGGSFIEPGVCKTGDAIESWTRIKEEIGPERTVLRVDPIIPRYWNVQERVIRCASPEDRVRISFVDMYSHVKRRFQKHGIDIGQADLHSDIVVRERIVHEIGRWSLEICGEPGLGCTGCVSGRDLAAMGITESPSGRKSMQRPSCCCIAEKVELLSSRHSCRHGCLYCYWKD